MVGSFKVDNTKLGRGIYLSKAQVEGNAEIITYDIRVRTPYKEPVMSDVCMHSVEHILANNLEDFFEKVPDLTRVYFGPMGSATGFYLVVSAPIDFVDRDRIVAAVIGEACKKGLQEHFIPANSAKECGNCNTLEYNAEVVSVLIAMKVLAGRATKGLSEYESIDSRPKVSAFYTVDFGTKIVQVNSSELSIHDIMALAQNGVDEFVKALKE